MVLRGPLRFAWSNQPLRVAVLMVSILGAAGVALAALEVRAPSQGFVAVMISAAIYWGGTLPLWLFNDRYYLAMLPAGCLLLAAAPPPSGVLPRVAGLLMLAVLGWFAIAGVYDQQRGLEAVMAARDALLHDGVPRSAIDAGYPLNGHDLYRDPEPGQRETRRTEAGIPLITSLEIKQYTIAAVPIPGTAISRRFAWPGVLGLGSRDLYLLKNIAPQLPAGSNVLRLRTANLPGHTEHSAQPSTMLAIARLAAMALMMLAPLIAVLAAFMVLV